ncbi:MAG: hypothetical protein QOG23_3095 [Blastocatellia bacterium]|jgi:hypothetical protein|nr:hypothetical protein [Blastocatellia bacterium]
MMQERRAAQRLRVDLNARWEALRTQGRGAVSDLGASGCFVLTSAEVKTGELIRLEINFPEETASFWGQVVYAIAEMGFALRFVFGVEDQRVLERLITSLH